MAYDLLTHVPEIPIKEEWRWTTDVLVSNNGKEDRIPLNRYPKRVFSGNYIFERVQDVRYHMALMFGGFGKPFQVGLYQYQVKLKERVAAGADTVTVNTARGDFRIGATAMIVEGDTRELVVIADITADALTFEAPLVAAYGSRALVVPVTEVYSPPGASFQRGNLDKTASSGFTFVEVEPTGPFVAPENASVLTTFDSLVLLDRRAIGTQFDMALDTGIVVQEYLGKPDVFTPWNQSQWTFPLRWQCNRVFDNADWLWWMAFVDSIQGSSGQFLLPTFHSDVEIQIAGAPGTSVMTLKGHEFRDHYYGLDTFTRIVIESSLGRHFAKVTGITSVSGNDRITFTPPLPAGAGWAVDQKFGFLMKVRIADDKVTCDHYGLHTDVTMAVRTVA